MVLLPQAGGNEGAIMGDYNIYIYIYIYIYKEGVVLMKRRVVTPSPIRGRTPRGRRAQPPSESLSSESPSESLFRSPSSESLSESVPSHFSSHYHPSRHHPSRHHPFLRLSIIRVARRPGTHRRARTMPSAGHPGRPATRMAVTPMTVTRRRARTSGPGLGRGVWGARQRARRRPSRR